MKQFINDEKNKRLTRQYDQHMKQLIQTGHYFPPNEFLWEDVLTVISLKKPLLLKGPAGSGKTKLAQAISNYFQQPMQSVNCSVDLDAESLLGFKTIVIKNGQSIIEFVEGPVVKAMKEGHILYVDEINMAKPETLPILHSVLDHRRMLTNPFTGEVIYAHEDFTVISAINEGYVGTTPMNEALKNRFVAVEIPYLIGSELEKMIAHDFPNLSMEGIQQFIKIHEDIKQQVENGLLTDEAASIRSLLDAISLSSYMPIKRALEYTIITKLDDDIERNLVRELARTWIG